VRTRTKLAALTIVVAVAAVTVVAFLVLTRGGGEKLVVREDRAPLARRLILPSSVGRVHWVAVAAFADSGWLEAPEKPYDLYALLEVDPALPRSSAPATVVLPAAVAHALLPASVPMSAPDGAGNVAVSGSALLVPIQSRKTDAGVRAAIRLDVGILLRIFQSGGF
jgi:hypothetical protein